MDKKVDVFRKKWVHHHLQALKARFPNKDEKELKKILSNSFDTNVNNRKAVLMNNYINKNINVNLLQLIDWVETVNPIIAGNGTFFKNQNDGINPEAATLDGFLSKRSKYKAQLKVYNENSYEYETFDRLQKSEKINANSWYGGSGNETFVFYNLFCAISTTATAQSLISTTETAFEAFLSNNTPFLNLDDCMNFIFNIVNDKKNIDDDFIPSVTVKSLTERLVDMFRDKDEGELHRDNINKTISSLSKSNIKRIYYVNNFYEFSTIPKISDKIASIFTKLETFRNPNKVPDIVSDDMKELWDYYKEFVMYNHFIFDRISRLKYEQRKAVIVVDTDSNMIHLGPFIEFVNERFFTDKKIVQDKKPEELLYIAINVMNYIITQMVNTILLSYTKRSNVLKEYRHRINMKNEFLYTRMVLSKVKKRYIGSIRLREGKEFMPEKLDIKGHDFVKSSCTAEVKEFMENIIVDEIIYSDDINVGRILSKITELEEFIQLSLNNAEKKFLLPRQVKDTSEYKKPLSIQQYKATLHWNLMYPDTPIQLPSNVFVIKLRLVKQKDLLELESTYPDIYKIAKEKILDCEIDGVGGKKGIATIAIPSNLSVIPQWIIDFIDYRTMINDNVSKFYPVLESLGVHIQKAKGGMHVFSNILEI